MNISKIYRKGFVNFIARHRYAHSVATSAEAEGESLQKQDPRTTTTIGGIALTSIENYSPVTHVSFLMKAGSRTENGDNLGITHCIRNTSTLSTKDHTSLGLTRHLENFGSKLSVTTTREYIIYTLQCVRDNIDNVFPALVELTTNQDFKPWEVHDVEARMKTDLGLLNNNPEALLMENLHKAAFRGGLSNSPYSPYHMIGKHTSKMLKDFVTNHYVGHRCAVSALGISHDHLETLVNKFFDLTPLSEVKEVPSKFGGVGEIRCLADLPFTRAALVAEGAGLSNMKDSLSLGVLQCILGTGPLSKFSDGNDTKLGIAASKVTSQPFTVSSINVNYSDAGMFGVYIAGHPDHMRDILKSVVTQMWETTKKISDEELKNGKNALKAKMMIDLDSSKDLVENMASQVALNGKLLTQEDIMKAIDSLSAADINAVASKVMKKKPAMVAMGALHNTPYLDELL